ncbi:MAG TPA: CehA/McbA family metallohydrolase [Candidatus Faecousia excrementipullorum]|nr:CehA/McbA family metallohydrolase [Candidatus Faecousia excrementipullorum]
MVPGEMTITVTGTDNKDTAFSGEVKVEVLDEPVITKVTPASGSETLDNKRPTISAEIVNAGENPTVTMTVDGKDVKAVYENGKVSYTPAADMADGRVTVTVKVARADGKTAEKSWSFTVGKAQFQLYFGQLHSHTTYSDGSGSLEEALNYVSKLPESANVDFVAFTDHSNYFDKSGDANPEAALYDVSLMTAYSKELWDAYKGAIAAFNESQSDVIAIGGFEMTWSGGPGHINTFNTAGIVSRNNTVLNNKTSDAGLKAYYDLLSNSALADSISQFNHPGSTFGTFADFSYWNALVDTRIQLVEVGNGEGQIGAGGYYPSYEYYTMALDKGWHVAPTNNQDNHKGKWGNANDARDVILTDNFTEEGLYEAIRNYRVYSTEDKNLEIYYTVNGQQLGSIIEEVPEKLDINVLVNDPDASDSISKVEIIVNSGKVAYTWDNPAELATGNLSVTLDPTFSYYYVRVTQGDGDLAVTAPVWVGESLKLGISEVTASTSTPVTGEELTLSTKLFNSETTEATVSAVTYTVGSTVLGVDKTGYTIPASGELTVDFKWTPETAKVTKITVTAIVSLDGEEFTFTKDIELDIQDADKLVYVGIDASHYNEYVNGNYKDSMGNFGQLAAEYSVRTVILKTSEELIAACGNEKYKAIILTAPSRRDGTALRDPYLNYTDAEIAALVDFNKAGGTLVLAGWSDYYEHYSSFPAEDHMAAQQNKVLEALGSSLRIGDDATNDDELNGGQTQRLYFSTYNWDNFLMEGVEFDAENPNNNLYSQLFSQYGGASIYAVDGSGNPTTTLASTVSPVVFGHASTYSKDSDNDGIGGDSMPKYSVADGDNRLMVLATEQLEGRGLIVVSGAAFMSNFEVQAQIGDNGSEKNYSNYNICENLIQYINPVEITPIQQVQDEPEEGVKFTIEGVVTSNASGYDKNTAFFDCIYLQDSTGGINAFPVAGNYKIGDILRITGTTSSYQGERQINVTSVEKIGETTPVAPKEVTAKQINDGSVLGQLVKLKGTVVSFEKANGLVQTIIVKDAAGNEARIFIDGYITTDKDVVGLEVGCNIEVVGCASYDNSFAGEPARIRVRDRADVVCSPATTEPTDPTEPGETTQPTKPGETTQPTDPNGPDQTGESFNLVLVMVALVVSAACLVAVVVFSKKYKAR